MSGSNRVWLLIASLAIPLFVLASLLYGQSLAAPASDVMQAASSREQAVSIVPAEGGLDASVTITSFTYLPIVQNSASGKHIRVLVPGSQGMAAQLAEATKDFSSQTGHAVIFEGVDDFEATIVEQAISGRAPDLAFFPQPSLLGDLATAGYTIDLNHWFTHSYLQQQYDKSWLDMATINGQMAGVWYKANVKSLVWYPVSEFEGAGYSVPKDWNDLIALSNQIVSDGGTPWCIGIESGPASGWVGTDWVEDIMLRTTTPANYDAWVTGDLPFSSDVVSNTFQIMAGIWFTDDYVLGGRTGIQDTNFGDAPLPMFEDPPRCWLHRQASFIRDFFPDGVEVGVDVDYFVLPSIDPAYDDPVLMTGDIVAPFHDRPEVREFLKYLTTADSVRYLVENGSAISPHKDAQLGWYPSDMRGIAEILVNADTVRFDGSDMMPSIVGAGAFWQGIVDYVNGEELATILANIDNVFPDLSGKVLTVLTKGDPTTAGELRQATSDFMQNTGHRLLFAAIPDFEITVMNLARSGQAPDLALFPSPWHLGVLANEGYTVDLSNWLDPAYLSQQYEPS
ncbi:MAG TPA: ABC transporter substrate-binding protein [candidate division Zixibacteria bacterium]|nr:ABC transporter substrate-binding protein [candidate division Zixibacteria bacterium]